MGAKGSADPIKEAWKRNKIIESEVPITRSLERILGSAVRNFLG